MIAFVTCALALGGLSVVAADAAAARAVLVEKLETVNRRLARFEQSKDRIFIEQHLSEARLLRDERERIEGEIAALDAPVEKPSPVPSPTAPLAAVQVAAAAQVAATNMPVWVGGRGVGYAETCVTAVSDAKRTVYWLVRREFDSEGRLEKVIPVCEIPLKVE